MNYFELKNLVEIWIEENAKLQKLKKDYLKEGQTKEILSILHHVIKDDPDFKKLDNWRDQPQRVLRLLKSDKDNNYLRSDPLDKAFQNENIQLEIFYLEKKISVIESKMGPEFLEKIKQQCILNALSNF